MGLTKTASDRELDRKIAGQRKMIEATKPGSWTRGKLEEALADLLRQRALPRDQRVKYGDGSI